MKAYFSRAIDESTLTAGWRGVSARRIRKRWARRVALVAPTLSVMALAIVVLVRHGGTPATLASHTSPGVLAPAESARVAAPVAPLGLESGAALPPVWSAPEAETVTFDDGSHAFIAAQSVLRSLTGPLADPRRVQLALDRGATTFDIKPGGPRAWIIDGGGGTFVRVLGTRFTVVRQDAHVHVAVERGKVQVESPLLEHGPVVLTAGQEVDLGAPKPIADSTRPSAPPTQRASRASAPAASDQATARDPFVLADAARKARRPRDAIALLAERSQDPLAAFTIAKIHMEDLAESATAAIWFDRALGLGLPTGLDEEALSRLVEAYGRADMKPQAAAAAARYAKRYPEGRHRDQVSRWMPE